MWPFSEGAGVAGEEGRVLTVVVRLPLWTRYCCELTKYIFELPIFQYKLPTDILLSTVTTPRRHVELLINPSTSHSPSISTKIGSNSQPGEMTISFHFATSTK